MFKDDLLDSYGLKDTIVGGKPQIVHSDRQFILLKLPIDLEFPEAKSESKLEDEKTYE